MVAALALIVPFAKGEAARQLVASMGIGRTDLKLGRRDGMLLIPILSAPQPPIPDATVETTEFEAYETPRTYKDLVVVPPSARALLPTSFDIVGDLVVIKIPPELREHGKAIGRAILQAHPKLRGVFHDAGVGGELRLRRLLHLAGENRTRTIHAEYGARLYLDLTAAYFSPRLANEHQRVALAIRPGEHFVDATAGVGPYSILAARRHVASRITAIDLNREALALLRENARLNKVEDDIEVLQGDATKVLPSVAGFNRIAINLPHGGDPILESAWRHAAAGAMIHFNAMVETQAIETAGRDFVKEMQTLTGRGGELLEHRVVHPYSPTDSMASFDFSVHEPSE